MRARLIALLCLLPLVLSGCVIPTDRDLAEKIERTVQRKVHPESVSVRLHRVCIFSTRVRTLDIALAGFSADNLSFLTSQAPPKPVNALPAGGLALQDPPKKTHASRQIRIDKIHLRCERFSIKKLPVAELDLTIHETRLPFDAVKSGHLAIESIEKAEGSVVLTEQSLTQYLRTCRLPITDPTVRLTREGCAISGEARALAGATVEISGKIMAKDEGVLYLENPKIRVLSLALPSFLTDSVLKEINPLIDLNTDLPLPGPVTVTRVAHEAGQMRISASMRFEKKE